MFIIYNNVTCRQLNKFTCFKRKKTLLYTMYFIFMYKRTLYMYSCTWTCTGQSAETNADLTYQYSLLRIQRSATETAILYKRRFT